MKFSVLMPKLIDLEISEAKKMFDLTLICLMSFMVMKMLQEVTLLTSLARIHNTLFSS
jgi:hypothetical protein